MYKNVHKKNTEKHKMITKRGQTRCKRDVKQLKSKTTTKRYRTTTKRHKMRNYLTRGIQNTDRMWKSTPKRHKTNTKGGQTRCKQLGNKMTTERDMEQDAKWILEMPMMQCYHLLSLLHLCLWLAPT